MCCSVSGKATGAFCATLNCAAQQAKAMSANSLETNLHMNPPRKQFSRLKMRTLLISSTPSTGRNTEQFIANAASWDVKRVRVQRACQTRVKQRKGEAPVQFPIAARDAYLETAKWRRRNPTRRPLKRLIRQSKEL